jgi:hypothetical protein
MNTAKKIKDISGMAGEASLYQLTPPPAPPRPRFEVTWDGYTESSFKVVDNETKAVLKEFDCALMGTNLARKAAARIATQLNGELRQCPECGGAGRIQLGASEQSCIHCNGTGFQVFRTA